MFIYLLLYIAIAVYYVVSITGIVDGVASICNAHNYLIPGIIYVYASNVSY